MREYQDEALRRIGLAFVIIVLFCTTLATAVFLITHTQASTSGDNAFISSPTPNPDELIIGGNQTTLPETKGVKAPEIKTPAPNIKDNTQGPSEIFSPTPTGTPLTTDGDTKLPGYPTLETP